VGARRVGRERALQALFQLEQDGNGSAEAALEAAWSASDDDGARDGEAHAFALSLVTGVRSELGALDGLLEQHSHNWRVDRMQRIDRNVLRLGAYELLHCPDIPKRVTLNEAIELAKRFGNEDSAAFINGLLDRVAAGVEKA
jgi:transcription antitermination protein NusB